FAMTCQTTTHFVSHLSVDQTSARAICLTHSQANNRPSSRMSLAPPATSTKSASATTSEPSNSSTPPESARAANKKLVSKNSPSSEPSRLSNKPMSVCY